MKWLPLHIDLHQKTCLIVGGGSTAERKCDMLLRAGARLTVIAKTLSTTLQDRLANEEFNYHAGDARDHLHSITQYALIICASNDRRLNAEIAALGAAQNIPVNVVDDPALSTAIFPAIIDHAPLLITVTTSGKAPILASLLKAKIQSLLPANLSAFTHSLAKLRQWLQQTITPAPQRRVILNHIVNKYLRGAVSTRSQATMDQQLMEDAQTFIDNKPKHGGRVYFIGAGSGDPELLTLKAHRILQNCDIVLYDHLISKQLLHYVRRDADKHYVGKQSGKCHIAQDKINQRMLEYVNQGLQVVRLKGGDPAIFSRGGEEYAFLQQHGIAFHIIPGVTAALACAATLQIPLTHRHHAHGCLFITAHTAEYENYDWKFLAQTQMTLVFYMGLKRIAQICQQLSAHGMSRHMPMAIIEQGTLPQQRTWTGTIHCLPDRVHHASLQSPILIIIGQVVNLSTGK